DDGRRRTEDGRQTTDDRRRTTDDGRQTTDKAERLLSDIRRLSSVVRRPYADLHAPFRYCDGSTGVEPLRISKCSCGEVTLPVWPEWAMPWPRFTVSPRLTRMSLAGA